MVVMDLAVITTAKSRNPGTGPVQGLAVRGLTQKNTR
jgi:hypothetical protein